MESFLILPTKTKTYMEQLQEGKERRENARMIVREIGIQAKPYSRIGMEELLEACPEIKIKKGPAGYELQYKPHSDDAGLGITDPNHVGLI